MGKRQAGLAGTLGLSGATRGAGRRQARRRRAILEHASPLAPVLGLGLGKTGRASDLGTVTRAKPGPPRRGPGRAAALGAGRWSGPPSARANPGDRQG